MRSATLHCLLLAWGLATLVAPPGTARAQEAPDVDWSAAGVDTASLLSGYIRIDTTNPPGNETAAALYLRDWFAGHGLEGRILEGAPDRGSLLVRLPATDPEPGLGSVVLLSHSDVVPADPDAWSFPPFSGAIRNGMVYGRGALDDKGQGAVHAMAMVLLDRLGGPRRRDVVFLATPEEETSGRLGAGYVAEHHMEALGPPSVVWNEGGIATRNALVGDRVLCAIATTEKRALWLTLVAEGEGGHGSQPVRDGANDRLVRALARIAAFETPLRATPSVAELFRRASDGAPFPIGVVLRFIHNPLAMRLAAGELTANRITNAMVRDTIAITQVRSGLKHNMIPRRAEATLDIRLLPDTDAATFLASLRAVIDDPEIRIEGIPDPLPPVIEPSPVDNELFRALEAEMAREVPGSITVPLQTTGGTDSGWFRERGIPAYGFLPAVLPEGLARTVHGLDERVPVEELERAVRVTTRTLLRLVR